jgi:hypothetical protein
MDSTADGVASSSKAIIDKSLRVNWILDLMGVKVGAHDIFHSLMKAFIDSVGLRVDNGSSNIVDAIDCKDALKGRTCEFSAWVMDATERARITREPFLFKLGGDVSRRLVINADDLR